MRSRILSLLLLACLVLVLPAAAETALPVFPLYDGEELLGTCVLFGGQSTFLTSCDISGASALTIRTPQGDFRPEYYSDTDSLVSYLVIGSGLEGVSPCTFGALNAYDTYVHGVDASGKDVEALCTRIAATASPAGIALTAPEGLLPGAMLSDAQGSLTGLVTASYSEIPGRYFALTSQELISRILAGAEDDAEGFIPFEAELQGNRAVLRWDTHEDADDGYQVFWMDTANSYYNYRTVTGEETSVSLVPGREYTFYVKEAGEKGAEGPDRFPAEFEERLTPPPAAPATAYSFRDTDAHLAWCPDGSAPADTENLPELENLSLAFPHEGIRLFFQITSTYEVTEEILCDLTCVLYAPDGSCYSTVSQFLYAPQYMSNDVWHIEVTELFDSCAESTGTSGGEYRLAYYLDDTLASEITLTIPGQAQ